MDAPRPQLGAPALGGARVARHHAVDLERRLLRDVAVVEVRFYFRRVALERVAEAAGGGPQHRVDVRRVLREVLLPQAELLFLSLQLIDIPYQLRTLHALRDVGVPQEAITVHRARIAAHHAGRGRDRVAGGKRVVRDLVRAVRDEARLGAESSPEFTGAA